MPRKKMTDEQRKEARRAYQRKYYHAHRDEYLERGRKLRVEHADELREYHREYNRMHPEISRRSSTRYRMVHPGRVAESVREWDARRRAKEAFDTFVRDAQALGAVEVGDLTKPMVEKILAGHPPRFAQVMYQYAHAVLTRLGCPAGLWPPKPRHAPSETTHREPLTPEQRGALLAEADRGVTRPQSKSDGAEFARLVRWMIHTGLRMSDAATLRMANINAETMAVSRKMSKTSKTVWLPLHRELHEDVRRAEADGREMLFPMLARKEPHVLSTRFRRLFARAGIHGEPGQFCAHCLRTTFASICAENGVPMGVIQSWLGHSSQEVTRIYARVEDMRAKRAALANIPDLG